MANLRLYPSGLTVFQPSGTHTRVRPERRPCSGWTLSSTRRLVRWLYSLDLARIDAPIYSFTLTLRNCPPSPDHWKCLREAFFRRLHRLQVTQIHWLTEWQRRGVPHLHGIVILPCDFPADAFVGEWLLAAREYRPAERSQYYRPIYDALGWQEYLGKHSARGVTNYQRAPGGIPEAWKGRTGRMWGSRGVWPTYPPMEFYLSNGLFYQLRRLLKKRALSLARARRDYRGVGYARTMLKHHDPVVSRVRGLSLFLDTETALTFLDYLRPKGRIAQ